MNHRFLLSAICMLMALFGPISAQTIEIGTGTSTSSHYPYGINNKYSTTQSIYTAAEMGGACTITSIAYNVATTGALSTSSVRIYMGHRSSSSFSSKSDYEKVSNMTLVYSGSPTLASTSGWETFTLSTPFIYNGTSNLVVVVAKQASTNISANYYCTSTSSTQCLYRESLYYSDYGTATNTSYDYWTSSYRANVRFEVKGFTQDGILFGILGDNAFVGGTTQSSGALTIPASVTNDGKTYNVTSIGSSAFYGRAGLTSITIPSSVTLIAGSAFQGCTGLTSITIPSSVTSIGRSAFSGCTGNLVVNSNIPSATNYSDGCFYNAKFSSVEFGNDVTSIGDYAFYKCTDLTSITIPSSVTSIGSSAFYGCTGLTSITIPSSVTSIGNSAFYGCTGLTSITIPSSVTSIGSSAFSGCTGLTNISVDSNNITYDSRDGCNALIETATNKILAGCQNTVIPSSVTSIGRSAFSGCTSMTSITIPSSVTSIGSFAFSGCTGLTSITIPDSVTSIGSSAFSGCTGLTSITIPDSVTSIDSYAFRGCTGLTSITIPSSVTSIGSSAFEGCTSLMSVTNYATTPQAITANTFPDQGTLHVLPGCKDLYSPQVGWKNFYIVEDAVLPVEEENTDAITIADGTAYTSASLTHVGTLRYSRTFNNTNWQALYIPISMKYEDYSDKLEIAWLNDTHMYDDDNDGVPDRTMLEFFIMNSGETEPNTPYLVRAKEAGTFSLNLDSVDVSPAVCDPFECSTFKQTFTVYGTYSGVTGADMVSNHYYAPANGKLSYANSTSASLKPQRWYLKVANKDGSAVTNLAPSIRMMIDGEMIDEEATGIDEIASGKSDETYYTIDGRNVAKPNTPGLYVRNNKKVIVR